MNDYVEDLKIIEKKDGLKKAWLVKISNFVKFCKHDGFCEFMSDLVTVVSEIEFKARKLANLYRECKTKNDALSVENEQLRGELEELRLQVKKLQYSKHIVKIAKALEKEKGSTEAKRIINGLLREVDRCIGLLND